MITKIHQANEGEPGRKVFKHEKTYLVLLDLKGHERTVNTKLSIDSQMWMDLDFYN